MLIWNHSTNGGCVWLWWLTISCSAAHIRQKTFTYRWRYPTIHLANRPKGSVKVRKYSHSFTLNILSIEGQKSESMLHQNKEGQERDWKQGGGGRQCTEKIKEVEIERKRQCNTLVEKEMTESVLRSGRVARQFSNVCVFWFAVQQNHFTQRQMLN